MLPARGLPSRVKAKDAAEETLLPADSCVLSVGYIPDRRLADALLAAGRDAGTVHVIGDADAVGNLMSAVWAAYELCYKL